MVMGGSVLLIKDLSYTDLITVYLCLKAGEFLVIHKDIVP